MGNGEFLLKVRTNGEYKMKRLIMTAIMLSVAHGYAQTTNWTFQWHGQTMGLDFEVTNLTKSVKAAIRDDIAYSMSLIPTNDVTFNVFPPNSPDSSNYTGRVRIPYTTPINYCDGILCFYNSIGGNVYWKIGERACSEYLAAIALTNQYAAAMNSFSNFHHHLITGFDTTGMTLAEKKAFFLNPYLDKEEQEMGADFEPTITAALSYRPPTLPEWEFPPKPSILAFSKWKFGQVEDLPIPELLCTAKHWEPVNKTTN